MKNLELEILKNAVELQEQLGFKKIGPQRSVENFKIIDSNWLSVRIDSNNRISLAFSFNKELLEKEGWWSDKIRANVISNGRIVIFELNSEGNYALHHEKGANRVECKITWQKDLCKKPESKEKYRIEYLPMNAKGMKRLVLSLPSNLVEQ